MYIPRQHRQRLDGLHEFSDGDVWCRGTRSQETREAGEHQGST